MGNGSERNKKCICGSGLKAKHCKCEKININDILPEHDMQFAGGKLHLLGAYSNKAYPDIGNDDFEKLKYAPFYNQEQINRIFNPKNGHDVLLKMQADSIINNMRITREMFHRYDASKTWNIEEQFDKLNFDLFFLAISDKEEYSLCKDIPCGTTYDSEANGQCIKTEYGNIITFSSTLKNFLYFMNLFYLGVYTEKIPKDVTANALTLAIRIMLKNESLDFDMDPRGNIPNEIDADLKNNLNWMMLFVIAHEYSHSVLGHLDDKNIIKSSHDNGTNIIYNQNQKQELEADINAIQLISGIFDYEDIILGSISFFLSIDLYEQAKEQVYPSMQMIKTHPPAIERIKNICEKFEDYINIEEVNAQVRINEEIKKELEENICCNFDDYERYGSVYLGCWHEKELIDRVDY